MFTVPKRPQHCLLVVHCSQETSAQLAQSLIILPITFLLGQIEDADESGVDSSEESDNNETESEEEMVARIAQESLDDDQCGKFYCIYFTQSKYWGKLQKVIFLMHTLGTKFLNKDEHMKGIHSMIPKGVEKRVRVK